MLCDALATEYQYAVTAAQSCTLGAASQCQLAVPAVLAACGSCPTFVNDDTKPKAIQAQWQAAGCLTASPPVPCVQTLCIPPPSMCVASDSGGASCAFVSGAGGSGGSSGKAGSTGSDGGISECDALATKYQTVLSLVQSCTVGATGQCGQLVPNWLSVCSSCSIYVNDASTLNQIQIAWNQAGCANKVDIACPAIDCIAPISSSCIGPPGGTGSCSIESFAAPAN
jgi:hypothetical protein